ncbi:ABC transporter permease [Pollutimonas bauzanensis]|uniref:Putative ABC transport system permease protein n=1 Tax=Pollutimonas bauzanensis TaxID=658167 RepID=A0A1M5ZQW9_9BURK|nr:FtsX-like permease family protein [Pollutimonas bauzanensis]SHI26591.1 putative ABC transport system permease protein [Pollutimonas bauzanensis]
MRSSRLSNIWLGVRALRRDWHSGEIRLLALALVIAVAAVTSVGFLSDRVGRALERDSAQMLGGDLALQADEPIPADFIERARALRLDTARTLQFPSMVSSGEQSQLVSLKAVSEGYPLRGELRLSDTAAGKGEPLRLLPQPGTVWVDAQVLGLLGIPVGGTMAVGDATMKVARVIAYEPDRGMQFVNVAPRVMLALDDLPATGLLAPGSRVSYQLLVAGAPDAVGAYKRWLDAHMKRGQKLSSLETNRPEVQRALDRAHQFLVLVALLTVMIAAVAVALAARRFSLRHQDGIAIMRCLGAGKSQLTIMLWLEFLLLALIASAAGALAGFAVHQGLVAVVAAWLDTSLPAASWQPALQGLVAGLLLLLGFALPPLAALRQVPPARVLRRDASMTLARRWPAYGLGVAAFFLLIVWISGDMRLSLVISAGFLGAFFIFAALAYLLVRALGFMRYRVNGHPALRFALAGMARRRGLTVTQLCSLAMGLMILLLLAITRSDLLQSWQSTLPPDAPNTFLINIQPDQRQAVAARLERAGIRDPLLSPMVRGRLLAINQQAVNPDSYTEDRARRLVDREFNLSYTDTLPASNEIAQGRWLDPAKAEVSLESGLAKALGIHLRDRLTFDVAGRAVEVVVSSVRAVKWDSFQANFFAIMSPIALKDAPATFITSMHVPAAGHALTQDLVRAFPNLTVFDVGSILGQVQRVLDQVVQAVQLLFLFTVAAGILVLGAALFSTRDERMHEVAVLRALGASGRQLAAAMRIELLVLGAMAGLLAAFGAVAIAWVLADQVFDFTLALSWWPWLVGVAAGMLASAAGGHMALAGVLKTPPLVSLREAA